MSNNPNLLEPEPFDALDLVDAEEDVEDHSRLFSVLLGLTFVGGNYLDPDGTPISREDERRALDELLQSQAGNLKRLMKRGLAPGDLLDALKLELRREHLMAAALGKGGFDALTEADMEQLGDTLAREFVFLEAFVMDMATLSDAQIEQRIDMYAHHLQMSFWEARRAAMGEAGFSEEIRYVSIAENCPDCLGMADTWQPLGTLPPPGRDSRCLSNCLCWMDFR